jgi:plastocyanin
MRKLAFAGIIIGLGFAAYAGAVTEVQIRDFEFVPATVVVMKGDSVKWTNVGQVLHTSTSDTGKWDSGDLSHGGGRGTHVLRPGQSTLPLEATSIFSA